MSSEGLPRATTPRIGEILVRQGRITEDQLEAALAAQRGRDLRLGELLVAQGLVVEEDVSQAIAVHYRLPCLAAAEVATVEVPEALLRRVPEPFALANELLPLSDDFASDGVRGTLVAVHDVPAAPILGQLRGLLNSTVHLVIAPPTALRSAVRRNYRNVLDMQRELAGVPTDEQARRTLEVLLGRALHMGASDVHLEAGEERYTVRMRVDGRLQRVTEYRPELGEHVIGVISVLAGFDVTHTREPRDGHFVLPIGGVDLDCRVSLLPSVTGVSGVLRLAGGGPVLDFDQLGLTPLADEGLRGLLGRSFGVGIVAGPTGSGKTTTLYAALRLVDRASRKVVTLEDPVEQRIEATTQIEAGERVRLPFHEALRSVLRHDPDVIVVGEVRDGETAATAVAAAVTGHLVLMSLHSTDCLTSVARLLAMGVAGYQIADSLQGVLAQRLVRRLCPHCREQATADAAETALWQVLGAAPPAVTWHAGPGCVHCIRGFSGRLLIAEWLTVSAGMRALLAGGSTEPGTLRAQAVRDGWHPMVEHGLSLARHGHTTAEEVYRQVAF